MFAPHPLTLSLDELTEAPTLQEAMREALEAEKGAIEVPAVVDLDSTVLARWLYRSWLDQAPTWRSLVCLDLDKSRGDRGSLDQALEHARGGWLHISPGWSALDRKSSLAALARRGDVLLLLAGRGRPMVIPKSLRDRLLAYDAYHATATDPALDSLRRSVLAHARAGGVLHLRGELHTGRADLVTLVHASHGYGHLLDRIEPGELREPRPGRWVLLERVEAASPGQLLWAEARERGRAPPPARRHWDQPPGKLDLPLKQLFDRSPGLLQVVQEAQTYKGWLRKNLLISGETGAGKEVLARAIHETSRPYRPFVHVDLNTLPPSLAEDGLFGHARGSYTDARFPREGLIRAAHEGTLFLDEIGRMPIHLQLKLLVVLQSGKVRPVGEDREFEVDVRWIAATNRDLEALVRTGEFLRDLLERLRGWELRIPSLRDRPGDIGPLADHHLRQFVSAERDHAERVPPKNRSAEELRVLRVSEPPSLSAAALRALQAWSWPGNVRELCSVVESAAIQADFGLIEPEHLGELASAASPCPVFLTSSLSDEQIAQRPPSEALLLRRLTTLTLEVPPLRLRGAASLRHRILCLLDGHPIDRAALDALVCRPWYGNLRELEREIGALRLSVEGPITLGALQRTLPHLAEAASSAPIVVLMHPTVQPDGTVSGLIQTFDRGALVVGRGSTDELRSPPLGDVRLVERLAAVRGLVGDGEPGVLSLGSHPELSRQHLVVRHAGEGLELVGLPGTVLLAAGGVLGTGHRYKARAGEHVPLGRAGEVLVMGTDGTVYLQIFVFDGRAAYAERATLLRDQALLSASPTRGHLEKPRVCWILDDAEIAALNASVLELARTSAGRFKGGLKLAAEGWRAMGLGRLGWYVDSSHPVQSCTRLYEHNRGQKLVAELQQAVDQAADRVALWSGMPKGIRELLVRPGPSISLLTR